MKRLSITIGAAFLVACTLWLAAASETKTNLTFKTDTTADYVDLQFKAGFAAGVKWGILSFMQHPDEGDVNFHIAEAQKWYWLVVVDKGKTLIDMAGDE
jgi:hypothetical protein